MGVLFSNAVLVLSSISIITLRKGELITLFNRVLAVVWLLVFYVLVVPRVGLWSVSVTFPGHTRLLFYPLTHVPL